MHSIAKPCTLFAFNNLFSLQKPRLLTETGVLGFLRRQEAPYHTTAKAVAVVNIPLLSTDSPKSATAFKFLQKFLCY